MPFGQKSMLTFTAYFVRIRAAAFTLNSVLPDVTMPFPNKDASVAMPTLNY